MRMLVSDQCTLVLDSSNMLGLAYLIARQMDSVHRGGVIASGSDLGE